MPKDTTPEIFATEQASSGLTPLVPLESFQDDVTNVFLHYIRNIGWMVDAKTAWSITGAPALERDSDLLHPELRASDLGLAYSHIKDTEFAKSMQRMYDYAYFGQLDLSGDTLTYESIHTWITALVLDVAGAVGNEWDSYGLDVVDCARRCEKVCDTANARRILEGHEAFYLFSSQGKEDFCDENMLNVRQVALLSGMEEMSIRAAANPNRANQLKPTKTEYGTRFESAVVKEWLIQKKRYVPITRCYRGGDINLEQRRFASREDLFSALESRYTRLVLEQGFESVAPPLVELGVFSELSPGTTRICLPHDLFDHEDMTRGLARTFGLPEELLLLRGKEAVAAESLRNIERAIKELSAQHK